MRTVQLLDDRDAALRDVVATLRTPGVAAVPTDTVYGVIADAFAPKATRLLRDAKEMADNAALTVLIRSPRQVTGLVSRIPEAGDRLMASYWPGPVTLVLPAADGLTWDIGTRTTVAVRMPTDGLLLDVIADIGPIVCSVAALEDDPTPTSVEAARGSLGDHVDLYVDGGPRDATWSTVVDLTRQHATVLRDGAVPSDDVELVAAGRVGWGETP